jgi:hypothetical protein
MARAWRGVKCAMMMGALRKNIMAQWRANEFSSMAHLWRNAGAADVTPHVTEKVTFKRHPNGQQKEAQERNERSSRRFRQRVYIA